MAEPLDEAPQLKQNITRLLQQVGVPGTCKGCGGSIRWVQHTNGKWAPYTKLGLNHFADCPVKEQFRKKGT